MVLGAFSFVVHQIEIIHIFSSFQVVAEEHLTPKKNRNQAKVTVYIEDVNDNWPEFDVETYTVEIEENSPRGTVVTTLTVSAIYL